MTRDEAEQIARFLLCDTATDVSEVPEAEREVCARGAAAMTTTELPVPVRQTSILDRPRATTGVWSWFTTIDHKKIAIMYGTTAIVFFLAGGVEALLIRIQLAHGRWHVPVVGRVQRIVHDARHDDGLPRRHAHRAGVRELPHPADDRRARRRVPAPEHARATGSSCSAAASCTRRSSRSAARPTVAGSTTRRSTARRCRLGFLPGPRSRLLGRRHHHARHRVGCDVGELHRHDAEHARAGHDDDAHARCSCG